MRVFLVKEFHVSSPTPLTDKLNFFVKLTGLQLVADLAHNYKPYEMSFSSW